MMTCTQQLLEGLWDAFPHARVGQYNYEEPCLDTVDDDGTNCQAASAFFLGGEYCTGHAGDTNECILRLLDYWRTICELCPPLAPIRKV